MSTPLPIPLLAPKAAVTRPVTVVRLIRAVRVELSLLLCAAIAFLVLPDNLGLLTSIAIYSILALSFSLIYGQAGIASMGHASLFGAGAYAAAILASHFPHDPVLGLAVGASAGALVAWLTSWLFITATRFTLAMLTIAVAQVVHEIANKAVWLTGGDNGFSGYTVLPLLGMFTFDLRGITGYWYAVVLLVLVYAVLRWVCQSNFGLTSRAIKDDAERVESLGGRVRAHLMKVYTLSGAVAGIAGALSSQVSGVVGLDSLGFILSIDVLIMVVLGGALRLHGAIVGATVFIVIQHVASGLNPHYWLAVIGGLLVFVMVALPQGLTGTWRVGRTGK
jgi:branched-chain amino acid transport system permease protein